MNPLSLLKALGVQQWRILSLLLFGHLLFVLYFGRLYPLWFFPLAWAVGLLFEFLTRKAWDYDPEIYASPAALPFSGGADPKNRLNVVLGLGWLANSLIMIPLGEALGGMAWSWPKTAAYAVAGLVVGNILEQVYLYFGLWKYRTDYWLCTLWGKKPLMLWGIPIAVRLGYGGVGLLCLAFSVLIGANHGRS